MKQQEWVLQEEKDIYQEAEYDWTPTYYEVVLKDDTTAKVMSFMDEDSNGGCHEHLIFAEDGNDKYDTDDIVKWRKM